jgi:hypothetical protein
VRFSTFVFVAAALHVTIPLVARIAPEPQRRLVAHSSSEQLVELEIPDVIEVPPPPPPEAKPEDTPPQEVAANDVVRPRAPDVAPTNPENPPPSGAVDPMPVLTAEPTGTATPNAGPEEWTTPAPAVPGAGVPGLGGPIWAVPGVIREGDKPKPAPTTVGPAPEVDRKIAGKLIGDVMREKDRGLGLDLPGAGAIGTIVSDVVRGSSTPDIAHATLEVRIAPGGQVSNVRVVSTSAGAAGDWSAVASAVKGRLAGRSFTLPTAYAGGAVVMVDVVSKLQLPDGSTGGTSFQKGGPSGGSVGGGVNFDVSNIGARPKRHVRALVSARPAT